MTDLAEIIRMILAVPSDPLLDWNRVETASPNPSCSHLREILIKLSKLPADPATPPPLPTSEASEFAQQLSAAFPARSAFCRRLVSNLEVAIRMWHVESNNRGRRHTGLKSPHVLILGQPGVGKTFLLSQALPCVAPDSLAKVLDLPQIRPDVVYIDARHAIETASRLGLPGPGGMLQALLRSADRDVLSHSETIAIICIDHLEAFWSPAADARLGPTREPEILSASLRALLRGVKCRIDNPYGPGVSLDTQRITFVAVAHVNRLRHVLEEQAGPSASRTIVASSLVRAGVPPSVAYEFPTLLVLPPVAPGEYLDWLETEAAAPDHGGFGVLELVARSLGCEQVTFTPEAIRWLFHATFRGTPDFGRLTQILVGLAADLLDRPEAVTRQTSITPPHLELAVMHHTTALYEL